LTWTHTVSLAATPCICQTFNANISSALKTTEYGQLVISGFSTNSGTHPFEARSAVTTIPPKAGANSPFTITAVLQLTPEDIGRHFCFTATLIFGDTPTVLDQQAPETISGCFDVTA
jgi:hypothetical protein